MEHTPFGYDIINGIAVVNEEKAAILRKICDNYLSGMSFEKAAAAEGLTMTHRGVRLMLQNPRYLGDGFYPPILTEETVHKIEEERVRRSKALGRDRRKKKERPAAAVCTNFSAPRIPMKYDDPIRQAEYAYGLIRNEVNG